MPCSTVLFYARLVSADIDKGAGTYGHIYLGFHCFCQAPIDLMRRRLECIATSHFAMGIMGPVLVELNRLQMSC